MKALILTGLLLSTTTSFAQGTHFLVAIKGERNPRSNLSGWDVDIGEVYQFVRGMSASEYNGGPSQSDNTYVVLQIDDVQVVARTEDFLPVADKDTVQAAMKYNEEVTQHRQDDQQVAAVPQEQQAQPGGQATPVPGLHHRFTDPRIEARYEAIAQGLIAEGKDASNEAVMAILQPELNGQATAQSQAQDIQNLQGEVNQTQQQIDQVRQDQQSESFDRAVQQQQQDGEHFQQQNEQDAQQAQQQLNNTYPPQ